MTKNFPWLLLLGQHFNYGVTISQCCPAHVSLIDAQLHSSICLISGTVRSTPLPWLQVLTNIEPPALRCTAATDKLLTQAECYSEWPLYKLLTHAECHSEWPLYDNVFHRTLLRLKFRKPLWRDPETIDVTSRWWDDWQLATVVNSSLVEDPTIWLPGFDLHRCQWSLLNHFRTGQGHCNACRKKWGFTNNELCDLWNPNNDTYCQLLSIDQVRRRTSDYCVYIKQMRWPSTGRQHMAPSIRQ